jgi:hypothetical protein
MKIVHVISEVLKINIKVSCYDQVMNGQVLAGESDTDILKSIIINLSRFVFPDHK